LFLKLCVSIPLMRKPDWIRDSALARMQKLFEMAEASPSRARRYAGLAKALAAKYKTRMPREWAGRVCRCGAFLVPGRNARVRAGKARVLTVVCGECGRVSRFAYARKGLKTERRK
jgi:RNase P subunit RPR2